MTIDEPNSSTAGESLYIASPEIDAEDAEWYQAARESFLNAYDDQDAIYDEL